MPTNIKKVLLSISDGTYENIEDLKGLMNDQNRSNVVAKSVELAKFITSAQRSNKKILVEDEDGKVKEIKFIGL